MQSNKQALKEEFRIRVTSIAFLSLPPAQQRNEIAKNLTSEKITQEDLHEIEVRFQRNLRVASLNVGYNVMSNLVKGSEAAFVEKCQSFRPSYDQNGPNISGWFRNTGVDFISYCSNNSALFLANYNLFALQEVNPYYQGEFIQQIRNEGLRKSKDFRFQDNNYIGILPNNTLIIGYDRNVMGEGILITPQDYNFVHSNVIGVLQAMYFPKRNLLFINVHAPLNPENINLTDRLNVAFSKIQYTLLTNWSNADFHNIRIIVAGDFKDCKGELIDYSIRGLFKIFNKQLRLHVDQEQPFLPLTRVQRTCCYPEYGCYGDYIFDSLPFPPKLYYFGRPIDYNRNVNLYSNHDPVVMLELDYLVNTTLQGEILRSTPPGQAEHIGITFKDLDKDMLYDIARLFLRNRGIDWKIIQPLAWFHGAFAHVTLDFYKRDRNTFPYITLDRDMYEYLRNKAVTNTKIDVTVTGFDYWDVERDRQGRQITENRWVVMTVIINDTNLRCPGTCHISIGYQSVPINR